MTEPWNTITLAVSGTLWITALIFRLILKWISSRTSIALCITAAALTGARAAARGSWVWAAGDALCALLMAYVWWDERPARPATNGGQQ
jgi:hypothetical protein